jgi:hypothetical protein
MLQAERWDFRVLREGGLWFPVRPDHRGEIVLVPRGVQKDRVILGRVRDGGIGLPRPAKEEGAILLDNQESGTGTQKDARH